MFFFIIVFPFLIFSKCHHPAINGAFLAMAFFFFFFFSMAECAGILFWSLFGFAVDGTRPLGCRTICIADPQAALFLFFAHANSMRRCLGPLHVPLKFPSIYSQLPPLGVLVTIRHGKKEQGKCDDAADKSRLPPLLTPSGVFCYLSTIDLCGASCLLFSAV